MGWFGVETPVVSDTVHSTEMEVEFWFSEDEWGARVRVWEIDE